MEGTCDSCGDQSTELKPAETQPGNLCPACYEWEIVNGNGNQTSSVPDDRLPWTDRTELIAQTINLPEWELLADQRLAAMFGDGQEKEMVWDGITIRGLMTMKFEELIEELETYGYCGYCGSFDHTKEDCPNSK